MTTKCKQKLQGHFYVALELFDEGYIGTNAVLPVGNVSNGEDVGRNLVSLLSFVNLDDLLGVDRKSLVGVNHHTKQTRVGLK